MLELRRPIDARQVWIKVPPTNKKVDMAVPYQELAEVEEKAKAYTDESIWAIPPPTPQSIGAIPLSQKGAANGVPILGSDSKVPLAQLTLPVPSQIGAIESSQKASPGGVASLDANAKVPLVQIPQSVLDRITTLEAQVANLIANQQTPTPSPSPTPSPTPSGTTVFNHDFAVSGTTGWLWGGSVAPSQDAGVQVMRLAGNYSELYKSTREPVDLTAGNYRLIANCRLEGASSIYRLYYGTHSQVATISNTSYTDVTLDFSLSANVTGARFGAFANGSSTAVGLLVKNFRIVKLS